jgi:predicted ATPase
MSVLIGHCSEQEGVPLLPSVEILEASLERAEGAEDLRRVLGDEGPELARMLPRRVISDLPQAQDLEARAARRLMFDSVCNFLARRVRERSALIIVEDLHWADNSTLELFIYVSQLCVAAPRRDANAHGRYLSTQRQ